MTGFKSYQYRAGIYLSAKHDTYLENANQCYCINGIFTDGYSCGFTYTEDGRITYRCQKKVGFASLSCTMRINTTLTDISLNLLKNGIPISGCCSTITFEKPFSYQALVVFKNIELSYGDVFSLSLMSNKPLVTATVSTAQLILWSEA